MKALAAVFALNLLLIAVSSAVSADKPKTSVGVYYFPGWYRSGKNDTSGEPGEWRTAIMNAAKPRALAGFYDDSDPNLWGYYIRWMTSAGIDFIAFDWYYNAGQQYLNESLDKGFLGTEKRESIKYCVHWCNHGGGWWTKPLDQTTPALLEMTKLLASEHFKRPNYLRIDSRPVLMIYDIPQLLAFGGQDSVKAACKQMRKLASDQGLGGIYLVAVYPRSNPQYMRMLRELGFDALCAYTYCWMRPPSVTWDSPSIPYPDQAKLLADEFYPQMRQLSTRAGLPYWPSTFPGWDDQPRAGVDNGLVLTDNSPADFEYLLRAGLSNTNPASPVVMVEAWNEWGEGACIEPSKEHGFGYLQAIASALGRPPVAEEKPSAQEIASWSILTPDELKTAEASESKPWPVKPAKLYQFGKSFTVPSVDMPVTFDLTSKGIAADKLGLRDLKIISQDARGLLLESTGGDPCIMLPKTRIAAADIRKITIDGKLTPTPGADFDAQSLELYWTTGLMPEFSQGAVVTSQWPRRGVWSIDTANIISWKRSGTPLLQLRIDPCSGPGHRVLIRSVTLSDRTSR